MKAAALLAGVLVIAGATVVATRVAASENRDRDGAGDVVDITIHYSHFEPANVSVHAGTTARFVIHNTDPIGHEFIIGDASVHERHERGTEAKHPPRPGEVSVGPGETVETTFHFDGPGQVMYACHLPGHFAYGMFGWANAKN